MINMLIVAARRERGPAFLTVPEVLREARISRALFCKRVKSGQGPTLTRIGERTLISRQNLADWLSKQEVGGAT
jgi:hypothetical protein